MPHSAASSFAGDNYLALFLSSASMQVPHRSQRKDQQKKSLNLSLFSFAPLQVEVAHKYLLLVINWKL